MDYRDVDDEIVTGTRSPKENEFIFNEYTNMGSSAELMRLFCYIESHSNIKIKKLDDNTVEQLKRGCNNGRPFNWKVESE